MPDTPTLLRLLHALNLRPVRVSNLGESAILLPDHRLVLVDTELTSSERDQVLGLALEMPHEQT